MIAWLLLEFIIIFMIVSIINLSVVTALFFILEKEKDLSYKVHKKKQKYYKHLNIHIVTPSKWLGEAAKQSALFSKFPVTVIPNPINTKLFSPGDKEEACAVLDIDSNKTYILYGAMYFPN